MFCSADDPHLEASPAFSKGISRCFDLVLLTHGQPLEPNNILIENVPANVHPEYVRKRNLDRANLTNFKDRVTAKRLVEQERDKWEEDNEPEINLDPDLNCSILLDFGKHK